MHFKSEYEAHTYLLSKIKEIEKLSDRASWLRRHERDGQGPTEGAGPCAVYPGRKDKWSAIKKDKKRQYE